MRIFQSTNKHKKYWKERKIDWKERYLSTWNHPHRKLIIEALKSFDWFSLWEVGCGPGANLVKITKELPGRQLGGSDINKEAIDLAKETFRGGNFHVEEADDLLISDDAIDVVLSDACLIYYSPIKIGKVLDEITRVSRNYVVLCEFYSPNWFHRKLLRLKTGYYAHDYKKLLEERGWFDIQIVKIPENFWKGYPWQPFGHIIVAQK